MFNGITSLKQKTLSIRKNALNYSLIEFSIYPFQTTATIITVYSQFCVRYFDLVFHRLVKFTSQFKLLELELFKAFPSWDCLS